MTAASVLVRCTLIHTCNMLDYRRKDKTSNLKNTSHYCAQVLETMQLYNLSFCKQNGKACL